MAVTLHLDRLKSQLLTSGLQIKDNPLFQVINQLIDAAKQLEANLNAATGSGSTIINQTTIIQQGPIGIDGIDGEPGEQAIITGRDGATGSIGATGPAGVSGINGAPGLDGEDGLDSLIPGPIGSTGSAGTSGSAGIQGYNGLDGEDGEIGEQGIPGSRGLQGDKGGLIVPFDTSVAVPLLVKLFNYNSAVIASVTVIYIGLDIQGNDLTTYALTWGNSTSTVKGYLVIKSNNDFGDTLNIWQIDSISWPGPGSPVNVDVTYISGSLPSNGEVCSIEFIRTGDKGTIGVKGTTGLQGIPGIDAEEPEMPYVPTGLLNSVSPLSMARTFLLMGA